MIRDSVDPWLGRVQLLYAKVTTRPSQRVGDPKRFLGGQKDACLVLTLIINVSGLLLIFRGPLSNIVFLLDLTAYVTLVAPARTEEGTDRNDLIHAPLQSLTWVQKPSRHRYTVRYLFA